MQIQEIISQYGYLAVSAGAVIQSESILLLGGLAAHRGLLDLPLVFVCSFVGTLFGNQLCFLIGYHRGRQLLAKHPEWEKRAGKLMAGMKNHQVGLILGFRYPMGMNLLAPILLGASGVSPMRFFLLNTISAMLWVLVIVGLGYLAGQVVELVLGDIRHYEPVIFAVGLIVAIIIWGVVQLRTLMRRPSA